MLLIVCDYRFMRGYGSNIYEWRVYGSARYSGVVTGTIGISSGAASSKAVVGLVPGIYIVGNHKVIVRQ